MSVLSEGQQVNVGKMSLTVERKLGSGAFGTVYKVSDRRQNIYALKVVVCIYPNQIDSVIREVDTLRKANYERIVQILAAGSCHLDASRVFLIVTEFCSGGDLNSRLNNSSSQATNLKWITQLSDALRYLHSLNPPIVHRDLKADNVLLTDEQSQDLKLGDFGLAREYLSLRNPSSQSEEMYYMTSGVGPIHWMAPEFFHQHYTEKADVFSLGGIFYAILTRESITIDSKKMYGVYLNYLQPHGRVGLGYAMAFIDQQAKVLFPPSFQGSNTMKRLIQGMLCYEPNDRPTASEVNYRLNDMRSSVQLSMGPPRQADSSCC